MFAQFSAPNPLDLAAFMGCLFFLFAGYNQVMKALDRQKDKPTAAEVLDRCRQLFATTDEVKALAARVTSDEAALRTFEAHVADQGEVRKNFIVDHVDGKCAELQTQINALPDKIFANLANLKTLGGKP